MSRRHGYRSLRGDQWPDRRGRMPLRAPGCVGESERIAKGAAMAVKAPGPVVVGLGGTEGSRRALAYGVWEARRRDARLHIVHAFQPSPMWGPASLVLNEYGWVADWVRDLLAKSKSDANGIDATVAVDTAAVIGGPAGGVVGQMRHPPPRGGRRPGAPRLRRRPSGPGCG